MAALVVVGLGLVVVERHGARVEAKGIEGGSVGGVTTTRPAGPRPADPVTPGPYDSASSWCFVENQGQWESAGRFVARSAAMIVHVEAGGILLQSMAPEMERMAVVRLVMGADGASHEMIPEGRLPGRSNHYLGNDPSRWRTRVPAYAAVRMVEVWPGVDVRVHSQGGRPEYDLLLEPGVDPASLVIRCEGVEGLSLSDDGSLRLETPLGPIVQPVPTTWQADEAGVKRPVTCAYKVLDEVRFSFEMPGHDPHWATVIDPGLEWATYLGGTILEGQVRVVLSPSGEIVVAGDTSSLDYPTTPGAYDVSHNGSSDAYVSILSPTGDAVISSTFLGGAFTEVPYGVAVGADASITVMGRTNSADFPTTPGAFDTTLGLANDVFITRLAPEGDALIYSTFLGGSNDLDWAASMALLPDGSVVVVGETETRDFPVTPGAFDTTLSGRDVFVSRLSPRGDQLMYSTLLGGSSTDVAYGVAVDPLGSVVVIGRADSPDFPTTPGAFDESPTGGFVAKFDPTLSRLEFSTILASHQPGKLERIYDVGVDPSGAVTVAGFTEATVWPVTAGAFDMAYTGNSDAFVTRIDPTGSRLLWSTYLGGTGIENDVALAVDSAGIATLVGRTTSTSFMPVTPGAFDTTWNGDFDAWVARLSPDGSNLWYGSYLGGSAEEGPTNNRQFDITALPDGGAVVVGLTRSADFPVTPGAFDTTYNGIRDPFVAQLDMLPTGVIRYGASTSGCTGPLAIGVTAMPQPGTAFGLTCTNAPASSTQGTLFLGVGALGQPVPAKGASLWIDPSLPFLLLPAASDALGLSWLEGPLPNQPGLIGVTFMVQFFWPNPCGPTGLLSASNALAITIQP